MPKARIATIQVILKPEAADSDGAACDALSVFLSDNDIILDWRYVAIHGQYLYPAEKHVSENYKEGDGFIT